VYSSDVSINLIDLKRLSERKLPYESTLRHVILSEPDLIPRESFLSKLAIWLNILYSEPRKWNVNEYSTPNPPKATAPKSHNY
jgi:hypothetical protein